jgi:hypothetical protein
MMSQENGNVLYWKSTPNAVELISMMKFYGLVAMGVFLAGCHVTTARNLCNDPTVIPRPALAAPVLSAAEIGELLVDPTGRDELLANIKLAAEKDLLIQPAFFEDAVLKKFFGASEVQWTITQPRHVYSTSTMGPVRHAHVSGMRGSLVGVTAEVQTFPTCTGEFPQLVHAPPPEYKPPLIFVTSWAVVSTKSLQDLDVGSVREVFGASTEEQEGWCNDEGFAAYCSANSLIYRDQEKLGTYPVPFGKHEVEFTPSRPPTRSADRRTAHFADDINIDLITVRQNE